MISLLPHAIDRKAGRDPEHEAVCFSGSSLTYGELTCRSNQLAHVLKDRGVCRGDRVGIYAPKGLVSAVAVHGIMKAGAAYVPLDPSAPPARAALIARDCGIVHIVSDRGMASSIERLLGEGVNLRTAVGIDDEVHGPGSERNIAVPWTEVAQARETAVESGATGDDLAYILYTSGSTGTPKGVVHTHRSAVAFAQAAAAAYDLSSTDRVTNHAPLHFDLSTLDYFAVAVAGATTVVIPEGHTKLPASLSKLLQDERVSVLYAVPLALTHLLLYGALEKRDLGHLRWVLFGGEPFPPKHLRSLMLQLPDARFANVYGPTEVNGVTTWVVPQPPAEGSEEPIPIGGPFANVDLFVVDEGGRPVASGEAGELWVSTPTMMEGYWGRPDLDERAFGVLSDSRPGAVLHRTGDLVRLDDEGVLHFLGRLDRQIKTRGYRVELDEVESVLSSHVAVETAAAFAVPDGNGSTAIEGVAVIKTPGSTTANELLEHAAASLPAYALPERLEILDVVPLTSSGKIDRVTLQDEATKRRESLRKAEGV